MTDTRWHREYPVFREKIRERARDRRLYEEDEIRELIFSELRERKDLPMKMRAAMAVRCFCSLCRLDVLEPLMEDEEVTDIMVNGADHIFYVKKGDMFALADRFDSETRLEDLIQQIVGSVNRSVNEADPIVDARLKDGSRVNVVLPPVSLVGAALTIRKFRTDPITMEELISWKALDSETADYLKKQVTERKNIFVCGGTSSGKTTLLNILSSYIDPKERVITIEDSAELRLKGLPNVVTMETREAGRSGSSSITMRDLIKASLRMNPDRLIIGEVRDAAAKDMLSGLNTGHAGMSTGHANSCRDMLRRLENMVWTGADIPLEAIRQQIASAFDLMVYLEKGKDGVRRVMEVVEIGEVLEGEVTIRTVVKREGTELVWNREGSITAST